MEIWIHINDCQEGPFAIDDLPVDRIAPDTPVWHDGLPDWVYAKDVPALAHLFADPVPEDPAPADYSDNSDNSDITNPSDIASPAEQEPPRQQPWEPLPPRQPQYPPQQQYCPPQQQYYPQYPPYPNRQYAYHGPMHRPMPQRPMPQRPMPMPRYEQAESSFVPKAPSMWLWLSIPVTILFGGSVFGIVAIILGIISRKKYKAGAYGTAIKLSRACEWLLMIGITLGFAIIPFSMFV